MTLTAVIITQDEERNICRCLDSLRGVADRVVVVDSGSTDRTEALCLAYNDDNAWLHFEHHDWAGYSEQKNYANSLVAEGWLLSIDADEALSPALRDSLLAIKNNPATAGTVYRMKRLTNYCGRFVRHCGWYPDAKVRLWAAGTARWVGEVHEELEYTATPRVVTLDGDLLHYSYYSVLGHAARQPRYYRLDAEKAYARGKRASAAAVVLHPLWTFLHDYLLRLGLLDGYAGFCICRLNAHYTFMKYAHLRELTKA